jgi:hypothetical protein
MGYPFSFLFLYSYLFFTSNLFLPFVIGSTSLLNEVELVQIMHDVFKTLQFSVSIKFNNRKFLNGVAEAQPPLTVSKRNGRGMLQRQCTRNYKIYPVTRKIRELCGKGLRARMPANSAEVWIGISMDEIFRMRPSRVNYLTNRHPLIEKRMTRQDCLKWLEAHGYPRPPKSSCWHCPYQSVSQWRDKRDNQPGEWKKAVEFDKAIRNSMDGKLKNAPAFVHTSGVPLDEVDLSNAEDHGQMDMFNNECEGMCGV